MSVVDWVVMSATLIGIIVYGVYRGRGKQSTDSYLRAGRQMPWPVVLIGIMATQASAITFLSAPGQAFTDGMRFVQYYFGLPIAMIVICVTFIPIFRRQNVYTAYEYLENRFDRKTRLVASLLFLLSRGLSTGISIYAPSIILSSIFDWNIYLTNVLVGGLLIIYMYGSGAKAIAYTQTLQFAIILGSMAVAGIMIITRLPGHLDLGDALYVAGQSGKLNVITTDFDFKDKYNLFSGIIGGFFLALSYFGTDQSQVGRYITGKDEGESRLGLLMNGLVKIPMQFAILLIGALLFALYSLVPSPVFFNARVVAEVRTAAPTEMSSIDSRWTAATDSLNAASADLVNARRQGADAAPYVRRHANASAQSDTVRKEFKALAAAQGSSETNDTNYILLYYVRSALPAGMVGLLFAVVFLASWGSISAAFHSLASSSLVDLHLLIRKEPLTDSRKVAFARLHSLLWGVFCIGVAMFASRLGSLIEAVNVLGSLFYGTILGIFLVAFYLKSAGGTAVFYAAIITEFIIVTVWWFDVVSFLWLNVIGAASVVFIAAIWPRESSSGRAHQTSDPIEY